MRRCGRVRRSLLVVTVLLAIPACGNSKGPQDGGPSADGGSRDGGASDGGLSVGQCVVNGGGDACTVCVCQSCLSQVTACGNDPGCNSIRMCAAVKGCAGAACYQPQTCRAAIDAAGGPLGASAALAQSLGSCVQTNGCACGAADAGTSDDGCAMDGGCAAGSCLDVSGTYASCTACPGETLGPFLLSISQCGPSCQWTCVTAGDGGGGQCGWGCASTGGAVTATFLVRGTPYPCNGQYVDGGADFAGCPFAGCTTTWRPAGGSTCP
jgi:hypothetical protein